MYTSPTLNCRDTWLPELGRTRCFKLLLEITVINASAAVTLLEQRPEKNSGSERDSNPRPLRCQCSALPTKLSKPHESDRMRVSPLNVDVILGPSIVGWKLILTKFNFHPTILRPSITSTFKGLTRIRLLSCGFDSSVGRALHWHRRGRGFESRSEPEFFSGLCSSSVTAALALMTVSTQLLLMDKINFYWRCTIL